MARYRTGLIYMTDRWGLGLYIMEYTGGYALPPLGLLVALSEGKFETRMAEVLKMTDKLETELPTMLAKHQDIVVALRKLIEAARTEHKPDIVHFRRKADVTRPD